MVVHFISVVNNMWHIVFEINGLNRRQSSLYFDSYKEITSVAFDE